MPKVISKVEPHFFLVRPSMFGHQRCTHYGPQNSTVWTDQTPPNWDHMWGRNMVIRIIHHVISGTLAQQKKHHGPNFPFPAGPSPSHSFPDAAGHFSLEPSPLKPDVTKLIFTMAPSLLQTVLTRGTPRMSPPPTALLSTMITSPCVCVYSPPPSRGGGVLRLTPPS